MLEMINTTDRARETALNTRKTKEIISIYWSLRLSNINPKTAFG
jgi:hypothetical protein